MKEAFVFYFPYRGFGGVPILFLRLAEKLASNGHKVYVIDYKDGYMSQNKSQNIDLISYNLNTPIKIPEKSHLILQSDLPWGIPQNFICDKDTKIFFWNCYPLNFIPILPTRISHYIVSRPYLLKILLNTFLRSAKIKSRNLVNYLDKMQAVVFMDEPNWKMTRWALGVKSLSKRFLPILVETKSELSSQGLIKADQIHIAWLGRIADFKIHSVVRIIHDLKKATPFIGKKIKLTIIGSGDFEYELKQELNNVKDFEYEILKSVNQNEIHNFLNSNIDLLCAMGTSALEGGISMVPTILMNFSYSPISDRYRYSYLFDTKNYSLGDLVSEGNISDGKEFEYLLSDVLKNKIKIGKKTYEYIKSNHAIEKISVDFLAYCSSNKLTYNKLVNDCDLKKPTFYKIWSIIKKLLK